MAEESPKLKPKPSPEVLELRRKAREAAAADGKDWKLLPKEERQEYKQKVGGIVNKGAGRKAQGARKAEQAK